MAEWDGKSRGNPLGYRIFLAVLNFSGVKATYALLTFVAFYYTIFSPKTTPHIVRFWKEKFHASTFKAYLKLYKTYHLLGQTLIDRVVLSSRFAHKLSSVSNGAENIRAMLELKQGGILLGAHVGNYSIASQLLMNYSDTINILVYETDREQLQQFLDSATGKRKFNMITILPDMSHIYVIGEALLRNELICMTADRFLPGARTVECNFMGEQASFPAGPFQIIKSYKVPYMYVYGFKGDSLTYQCYAKPCHLVKPGTTIQELVEGYAKDLEEMVRKYPEQWFNFYNFWNKKIK
jgi:predicted LPLAT superfamily acyltransferase